MTDPWAPVMHEEEPTPGPKQGRRQPAAVPLGLTLSLPPEVMEAVGKLTEAQSALAERFERAVEALSETAAVLAESQDHLAAAMKAFAAAVPGGGAPPLEPAPQPG